MNSPVPPVRSSWDRTDGWLCEHAPTSYGNLARPAGPGAVEAAQAELGLRFPADLTDSLLCHDGLLSWDNVLPGPPPQSVAQIVGHWRMCMEIAGDDEDLVAPSESGGEPWWHPRWIPWAQSDGNAQVIDMREGPQQGRLGTACHDDTGPLRGRVALAGRVPRGGGRRTGPRRHGRRLRAVPDLRRGAVVGPGGGRRS
ncbi:SMI1/KNR4 family protein [Streptomyces sp. NPDC051364]|uniref:SMI1/KNR4 family protein n=1 Tax=Streptomyces sp. NPDC051364 TaxID=3155799 RepID=UPI00342ECC42